MTASFTRRASQPRRSPPLLPLPPSGTSAGAGVATLVHATLVHLPLLLLLSLLSAHVAPAAASDRSLCFKMPDAATLVVKPELVADAAKVGQSIF
jgi:hypothetical protein